MHITFNKTVLAALVVAGCVVNSAEAQIPDRIFRDLIQQIPRPAGPREMGPTLRNVPVETPPNISSSKPTIDCVNTGSPVGLILCNDEHAARADWDVNASAWAYAASLEDVERNAFWQQHQEWIASLSAACRLTRTMSRAERECLINAYRARAKMLQSRLSSDALAETKLEPEQRAAIQTRLISLGLLSGEPDGQFGPNTRAAIKRFLESNGLQGGAYFTAEQRQALLASRQPPQSQARQFPEAADSSYANPPSGARAQRFPAAPTSQAEILPGPLEATPSAGTKTAQRFPTAPTSQAEISSFGPSEAMPSAGTKTVEVTGLGDTPDAARKDATRQAVQQVAGVFVDNRRRIELKMSDQTVSQIVEEKILSYTNAYVTKLDVLSTEHETRDYAVKARVTVVIAPLLATLSASNVPVVAFDAHSAEGTAVSITDEKTQALAIYADLLARVDELVKIGLGKTEAAPSIPSAPSWTWFSVPLTFFVNDERLQEWRKKFEKIANKRDSFSMAVTSHAVRSRSPECTIPFVALHEWDSNVRATFLSAQPGSGQTGVAACFANRTGPASVNLNCFGREYVPTGSDLSLQKATAAIGFVVEFLDKEGEVVHSRRSKFANFPALNFGNSRSTPLERETAFFNYCVSEQSIFFSANKREAGGPSRLPFGDVVTFPPTGSRTNTLLNILLPNDTIAKVASVRAFIQKGN